jgi:hypothetical protein
MNPVTSGHFTIWSSLKQCSPPTPCSASVSTETTTGTVSTSTPSQFLGTGIGGGTYSCATYQPVSASFTFDVLTSSGDVSPDAQFTAVLRIEKATVQSSGHPGASTWQVCYASPQQSPAPSWASGTATIGDVTYDTGLLPDCSTTNPVAPCVQARTKDNAGRVIVTFLASGDPAVRG